ncbi:MAG TPA: alginate lyase family protein, partial [Pseudonocardia sp.]|nr:alginate lyase family protein [Pseudonocardia sp.]
MSLSWYLRRLSRMGPAEIAGRAQTAWRSRRWRRVLVETAMAPTPVSAPRFTAPLPPDLSSGRLPWSGVERLLTTADQIMDGHIEYFGVPREDLVSPDWSFDPSTGRRAPDDAYAFDIPYRDESSVGNIKQLWEPSRHQYLTVLACAYRATADDRYAERIADHLKSWWAANPPMRGIHWISGIELGIRLISWVWVRRLLDSWPGAPGLFEENADARHHVWHHQRWLAAFPSRGSSANNHVIAEAAGQLVAASAFAWFPESAKWRTAAVRTLDEQLGRNTFESGLNRELATEYQGLVLELGLAAAVEARAHGVAVPPSTWLVLRRMTDALAAVVDTAGQPPRQGDGDDGYGLIVDGADTDRWDSLLNTGRALFGELAWWPASRGEDIRTVLLTALGGAPELPADGRPVDERPSHFRDAGMTILRTPSVRTAGSQNSQDPQNSQNSHPEVWCRCDGGPHGFLSIAAHAHADALSVEVRHDGVDVLADPGTYCYHGQPEWRRFFRSTVGHNTLELDGADQSESGGPFLWTRHARTRVLEFGPER